MEEEFQDIDGKNAWGAVYQDIRNKSNNYNYTFKDARKIENKILNRYRDVNPYDHSRIRLQRGDKDYINASLVNVDSANRSYILTQGPLPATTGHFWLMIWEQKSKAILMLNRVIEKNTVKCHQYWPTGCKNGGKDEMILTDVGLKVNYMSEKESSNYTLRELLLTDSQSGQSRVVLQFHYTTWPDFGVPGSPAAFLNFLFAVREAGVLSPNVGPPVVHCSAGIGRSGTFCLVDSCLVLIQNRGDVNAVKVQELLLEMRRYRMGLIQTPDQLRFSYQAIIEGAKMVLSDNSVSLNSAEHKDGPVLEPLETPSVEENENLQGYPASEEDISASLVTEDSDMETSPPPLPPRSFRRSEDLSPTSLKTSSVSMGNESEFHKCTSNSSSELVDIENQNHQQTKSKFTKLPNSSENQANYETVNTIGSSKMSDKKLNVSNSKEKGVDSVENETPVSPVSPTNSEAESTAELKKRKRKERLEKTAALVQSIKKKQRESETRSRRRLKRLNAQNSHKMPRKQEQDL